MYFRDYASSPRYAFPDSSPIDDIICSRSTAIRFDYLKNYHRQLFKSFRKASGTIVSCRTDSLHSFARLRLLGFDFELSHRMRVASRGRASYIRDIS